MSSGRGFNRDLVLKPAAKVSMLCALSKEDLPSIGIDIYSLKDWQLKYLYKKLQSVQQRHCNHGISCDFDFEEALKNNKLNLVSFPDVYKKKVFRRLTFIECLITEQYIAKNPGAYPHWRKL